MSRAKQLSKNPLILPLLAGVLEKEIPDLDIYGSEKKLLDFAFNDLITCLSKKMNDIKFVEIEKALNDVNYEIEIKSFLKIWTNNWLKKWRERVTFCQKVPQFSLEHIKAKKKAKTIFNRMKNGKELKKLVIQRLINNGEICMIEMIAENLITEEIASRLITNKGQKPTNNLIDQWSIFQQISPRVKRLAKRKNPIIHLKLTTEI
ncbi:hypothetical protein KJN74_01420, partial [Candidatus Bathyarchaeota archaeon]|nr:hypothetical protein [Candidatus Bathyarchaeota archaeon]